MSVLSSLSKAIAALGALATLAVPAGARAQPQARGSVPVACPVLLQFTFKGLRDERPMPLCQYTGKVLLVVNTASNCVFTSQYRGLQALRDKYEPRGFEVLAFPSNDFGQLEPGDDKQIAEFCSRNYGVTFPMFRKTSVVGNAANPFFVALTQATGKAPDWNFHKYLVDRKGNAIASFDSRVPPDDPELVAAIEKAIRTQ
jgi:glutathione peroxidase